MSHEIWTAVDDYLTDTIVRPDSALAAALEASNEAGLPAIQVSAPQGKLLHLLARLTGARAILEVGTLGGYSTIWLGRALAPGGRLITLELEPKHADVARSNLARAGLADKVEVRVGPAIDSLAELDAAGAGPFDLFFIDADKPSNPDYFAWAVEHSRPGSLIVVDNVIRDGKVVDDRSNDPSVEGVRELNRLISTDERVSATAIQTVGVKGYDGFVAAVVNG
jgi:predicted O-methyltransferase YrrM